MNLGLIPEPPPYFAITKLIGTTIAVSVDGATHTARLTAFMASLSNDARPEDWAIHITFGLPSRPTRTPTLTWPSMP